jgi:hypothetical protein
VEASPQNLPIKEVEFVDEILLDLINFFGKAGW